MKIATAGSHGVGKTDFVKALAEKLNFTYIHDIVREEAIPQGFTINENTPPEVQLMLVMRQWHLETKTPEGWVADKCLIDYLIYAGGLKEEIFKEVIKLIVERNAHYDFIFYLPIEFPMEHDGKRSDDEGFQKKIDTLYKAYLEEQGMKFFTLSGSVEERVEQALKHINSK
jgi:nicotinamide riboside kinase